jgi:hypothetical protein
MNRDDWLARARAIADRHAQAQPEMQAGHGLRPGIERVLLAELHALVPHPAFWTQDWTMRRA